MPCLEALCAFGVLFSPVVEGPPGARMLGLRADRTEGRGRREQRFAHTSATAPKRIEVEYERTTECDTTWVTSHWRAWGSGGDGGCEGAARRPAAAPGGWTVKERCGLALLCGDEGKLGGHRDGGLRRERERGRDRNR